MSRDHDYHPGDRDGGDRHAFEPGQPTPEQDLELARRALVERDLAHAAHHIACAFGVDPGRADAMAVADELIAQASDPLELTRIDGDAYYGAVALRAYVLYRAGQLADAVAHLLAVIGARPDVPFTVWLERWVDAAADQLDPTELHRAVEDALHRLEGVEHGTAPLPALIDLVARVRLEHPDHERLAGTHARLLRRAGRFHDAVAVARSAHERAGSYFTGVILASSLRDADDLDAALAVFQDVHARFPEEDAVLLDIGDLLLDLDRAADAVAAYQEILAIDAHHEWAAPSSLYAHYLDTRDGAWRDRLEDLAEASGPGRARQLADAITPYVGYLPRRPEALIDIAAQLADDPDASGELDVGLSSIEAPSAVRALAELAQSRGGRLSLAADVPEPDPRAPRRPVAFALWRYPGAVAEPTLGPPGPRVIAALHELAAQPYRASAWTEHAQVTARSLGVIAVEGLLGAMLHPQHGHDGWWPWDWTFRVQVAAALTLAFIDDGWAESARRAALTSLVYGPVDWISTAGLVALTRLAGAEPDLLAEIEPMLEEASALATTPIHHMCLIEPSVHLLLQLPGMSLSTKRSRRARRAELEAEAEEA